MAMMTMIDVRTGAVTEVDDGLPDPQPVPPTVEDYRLAVQSHIDATARARLYDSGVSLASYAVDPNPQWAAEAAAFVAWRSAVWQQVYALWDDPPDPLPTPAELIALLPEITWP